MEIEERYFKLLNLLICDKRTRMNGIISELCISQHFNGCMIYYKAYMSKTHANDMIFVEDIEKGNVVFLLPFGTTYKVDLMKQMAADHEAKIREFFGDKFRDDMIMRISEDERQEQIRQWESLTIGLENWERMMEHNGWTDAIRELPEKNKPVLCVVGCKDGGKYNRYQAVCHLYEHGHWIGTKTEREIVTWWRNLPEPPKRR